MTEVITYRTPETLHTRVYTMFRVIGGNRPISKSHVRNLVESYADNPDLIELRPVLVNEKFEIIDGQNRIEAMKLLGIEVPYQVVPGLSISAAQLMNATTLPWSLDDFGSSYAFEGNPHYLQFQQYRTKYGFGSSLMLEFMAAASGNGGRQSLRRAFKLGYFSFPADTFMLDSYLDGYQRVARVANIENLLFATAYLRFMQQTPDPDLDRLIRGIEQHGLDRKPTQGEMLEDLEACYEASK